jgi:dolichol kinase
MSIAIVAPEPQLSEALRGLALDVRRLVVELNRPTPNDAGWADGVRLGCDELIKKVNELRDGLGGQGRALISALAALGEVLADFARTLVEQPTVKHLRRLRPALVQVYQNYVAALKPLGHASGALAVDELRPVKLPKLARASFHAMMGLSCVALYQFALNYNQAIIVLAGFMAMATTLEVTRRFSSRWNDFLVDKVFRGVSRPDERYRINSSTWYLVALTAITVAAPQPVVCVSILVLALGDPIASLVGSRFGKRRLANDKSLVGALAFFFVSVAATAGYLFLAAPELSVMLRLGLILTVSLVGTLTELFSNRMDDNFTIPVFCAAFGSLWF